MKVVVDPSRCVTSGLCVITADTVFDQDDATGTVTLITDVPPDAVADDVRQAAQLCPAQAIAVLEDDDG